MTWRVAAYLSVVAFGAGCRTGGDTCEDAPPRLLQWQAATGDTQVDLIAPPDGGVAALSPLAYFELDFAGLLDGAKIETVADKVTPRTDVATITWKDAPAGAPPITAATSYNPGHPVGLQCGSWVRITARPGLPSGAKLMVGVARDKITSKGGKAFQGMDSVTLETVPFAVAAKMPETPVSPDFTVRLQFTNVAGDLKDHVHVIADGVPIAVEVMVDMMDPRAAVVAPAGGLWPPGHYMMTVDAETADLFGVKLAAGASTIALDVVVPGSDGGTPRPDAGAADVAADAPAADAVPMVDAVPAIDAAAGDAMPEDAAAADAPDDVSGAG
jgi:hypothetical protein